jgi:O-antigen ligase
VRDWLLTRTENEEIFTLSHHMRAAHWQADIVPARLRRILWVLCVNGALLGAEAIIQRVDGTDKLLWLVEPRVNKETETFFGVFAYRATAAQYFNLIWPLCLGFWWTYERARKKGEYHGTNHHVLLVCVMIMAACPVISYSRGGALIMAGMAALSIVVMVLAHWRSQWITKVVIFGSFAVVMYMALDLGGDVFEKRMQAISEGYMGREAMFETARKMPAEFPLFGSGPGSFEPLFQLYRSSTSEYWPAQLHNDWLETLITFGAVGMGLILTTFAVCLLHFFISNRIHGERHFVMLIWIALAGCLAHARFDFPLQVYSILLLFLLECAFLSLVSRRI